MHVIIGLTSKEYRKAKPIRPADSDCLVATAIREVVNTTTAPKNDNLNPSHLTNQQFRLAGKVTANNLNCCSQLLPHLHIKRFVFLLKPKGSLLKIMYSHTFFCFFYWKSILRHNVCLNNCIHCNVQEKLLERLACKQNQNEEAY